MNNTRCLGVAFAAVASLLMASTLYATPITIGQTVVPSALPAPGSVPPLLADITGTFNFDSGALTGSWEEAVVADPFGITCAGCLDFAIQVSVDSGSTEGIHRVGLLPFGTFLTDVNYIAGSGDIAPFQAKDGTIGTISFFFAGVAPGQTSDTVVIATNATDFTVRGSLGFDAIDDTGAIHPVPVILGVVTPTTPVPEPATLTLLGTGLLVARRRLRKRQG